jgi:hypothetical protein
MPCDLDYADTATDTERRAHLHASIAAPGRTLQTITMDDYVEPRRARLSTDRRLRLVSSRLFPPCMILAPLTFGGTSDKISANSGVIMNRFGLLAMLVGWARLIGVRLDD